MTTPTSSPPDTDLDVRSAVRLSRGISATWWYTVTGVLFLQFMLVVVQTSALLNAGHSTGSLLAIGVGGLVWIASTVPLLLDYRNRSDSGPILRVPHALAPLAAAIAYSFVVGFTSGAWVFAVLPVVQAVVLLNWVPGIRHRVVLAATVLLAGLWFIDARFAFPTDAAGAWWVAAFYSTALPAMTVLSLWWWDVLASLDRARASEARLGATQERLRVATDVHDLQGHHLQVIALQLELSERLLANDPDSALHHLRTARASVDEARQGTRDLATRYRAVSLSDELANAVDLLRAAGISAEVSADPDADKAPSSVFGPVIREMTTNILRHGGGRWARLSLSRAGLSWRLEIANDAGTGESPDEASGSGLDGIRRRAAETGDP